MPTAEQVRRFIREYPQNIKGMSYEAFVEVCNQHFPRLPILTVEFDNSPFFFNQRQYSGWNIVYRGRLITDKKAPYASVSEISFVPESSLHMVKKFGRANKKHEAMFYGAFNFATACIETISEGEDFRKAGASAVTVGAWKFEKPLVFAKMPPSVKYTKLFYETVPYQSKRITEATVKEEEAEVRAQLPSDLDFEGLQFFADAFAKFDIESDEDYYPSNYYTDRVLGRVKGFNVQQPVDGILYPSVLNSYEELNIVLKPEVVTSSLRFIEGLHIWAVSHLERGGGAEFLPIQQHATADENGIIKWPHSS